MNKNFYKLIPGKFDSAQIFTKLINVKNNANWVELNCGFGKTSCYIATHIKALNKNIKLDCIDTFDFDLTPLQSNLVSKRGGTIRSTFNHFMETAKLTEFVNQIQSNINTAVKKYKDESLDFIFIHDVADTKTLELWFKKLKVDGIIAGNNFQNSQNIINSAFEFKQYDVFKHPNEWAIIKNDNVKLKTEKKVIEIDSNSQKVTSKPFLYFLATQQSFNTEKSLKQLIYDNNDTYDIIFVSDGDIENIKLYEKYKSDINMIIPVKKFNGILTIKDAIKLNNHTVTLFSLGNVIPTSGWVNQLLTLTGNTFASSLKFNSLLDIDLNNELNLVAIRTDKLVEFLNNTKMRKWNIKSFKRVLLGNSGKWNYEINEGEILK